jgi:hypothetical protein
MRSLCALVVLAFAVVAAGCDSSEPDERLRSHVSLEVNGEAWSAQLPLALMIDLGGTPRLTVGGVNPGNGPDESVEARFSLAFEGEGTYEPDGGGLMDMSFGPMSAFGVGGFGLWDRTDAAVRVTRYDASRNWIEGTFEGTLVQIDSEGVAVDSVRITRGSFGVAVEHRSFGELGAEAGL